MTITEKTCYLIVFILVITGVATSHTDLSWYEGFFVREDGPIEWLTVLGLFAGAFISFYRINILKPFRSNLFVVSLFVLGCVFLFGLAEEISWGQRIFDFKSPQFFLENNSQHETNLHNLVFQGKKINKIIFGTFLGILVCFYFLILPFLYRKFAKVKSFVDGVALPLPKYFHIGAYIMLAILVQFIAGGKKGEILEFGGVWIFALMTLNPFNREIFSRRSLER